MIQDTSAYDSLGERPLPRWLTDQRDGLNTIQPVKMEMKNDRSLGISLGITLGVIFITVIILTYFIFKRKRKESA